MKTRILYVDLSPSPGGSIFSLLGLLRRLDREPYQPLVLLAEEQAGRDGFAALGVEVCTVPSRQGRRSGVAGPTDHGGAIQFLRERKAARQFWQNGKAWSGFMRQTLPQARRLIRMWRELDVGLVHWNDHPAVARSGIVAASWLGVPIICHARGFAPLLGPDRVLSRRLAALIGISHAVLQDLLAQGALPLSSRVVYNGVEPDDYLPPSGGRAAVRAELELPPQARVVGMVGRLSRWKGQHVFVRALAGVRSGGQNVCGLIIGAEEVDSPGYLDELRALTEELGLGSALRFLGFRADVPRLLHALDLLVHCSVKPEPFGRTIIEGMAAGLPVIASRGGGTVETIAHGEDGWLVPPGDAVVLADAMQRLLQDEQLAQALARQGRITVRKRFTTERTAREVEEVYAEVLQSS